VEAVGLPAIGDAFVQESGIEMSWMIGLFQDINFSAPSGEHAAEYADAIENPEYPVLADTQGRLLDVTPYEGRTLPGKCALSPQMEILECFTGIDNTPAFDAIRAHHAASGATK